MDWYSETIHLPKRAHFPFALWPHQHSHYHQGQWSGTVHSLTLQPFICRGQPCNAQCTRWPWLAAYVSRIRLLILNDSCGYISYHQAPYTVVRSSSIADIVIIINSIGGLSRRYVISSTYNWTGASLSCFFSFYPRWIYEARYFQYLSWSKDIPLRCGYWQPITFHFTSILIPNLNICAMCIVCVRCILRSLFVTEFSR